MADPTKPVLSYSYEGFQAEQQDSPFPGTNLDNDLAELKRGVDDTIDALKDVRRSDGALKNGIVTRDSLAAGVSVTADAMNPDHYDPNGIEGDVFDMANMVEAADAKIMTAAERTKLADLPTDADLTASLAGKLAAAANLSDLASASSARTNLGLGSSAVAALIDDDTMATATASNVPSAESVKAYVDAEINGLFSDSVAALKALDTAEHTAAYVRSAGAQFLWNPADLSSVLTPTSVTTTAVASTVDVLTQAAHGLRHTQAVYPTTTVNGLTANTIYYVIELFTLAYDAQTANFTIGTTLTGGTSGATGKIVSVTDSGATGTILLSNLVGNFVDNETITDSATGSATANGADNLSTNQFMLASSFANALAGTAVDLTGTTNLTLKRHIDPLEAMYVIPTGKAKDGSEGAWVAQRSGPLNVKWFGAVNDGVSAVSNLEAIQAAVHFAVATGGAIYAPGGTYSYSSGGVRLYESGIAYFGDGVASKFRRTDDGDVIQLDSRAATISFLDLHDFSVDIEGVAPSVGAGIRFLVNGTTPTGVQRSAIRDIMVFTAYAGVAVNKGALAEWDGINQLDPNYFNRFEGIYCHPDASTDFGLLWVGGCNGHNSVLDCHLRGTVAAIQAGDGGTDTSVGDWIIANNHITCVGGTGIKIVGPTGASRYNQKITIIGNDFDGTYDVAQGVINLTDLGNCIVKNNGGDLKGMVLTRCSNMELPNDGVSRFDMFSADGTTVNNSTTLVNVGGLEFNVDATEELYFEYDIRYNSNTTADIKFGFSVPAGCAVRWAPRGGGYWSTAGTWTSVNELSEANTLPMQGTGTNARVGLSGYILAGSTAGTVALQFAQNTADASNTTVSAIYSTVRLTRERNNF